MKINIDGNVENEIMYYYECNICVSDMNFKVIVLTSSGDFCLKYNGVQSAANRAPFYPRRIACDGRGNVLVGCWE